MQPQQQRARSKGINNSTTGLFGLVQICTLPRLAPLACLCNPAFSYNVRVRTSHSYATSCPQEDSWRLTASQRHLQQSSTFPNGRWLIVLKIIQPELAMYRTFLTPTSQDKKSTTAANILYCTNTLKRAVLKNNGSTKIYRCKNNPLETSLILMPRRPNQVSLFLYFLVVIFDLLQNWNKNKLLIKNYLEHQIPCNKKVNNCKPCHVSEKQRNYLVINLIMEHWSKWCHPLTPVTLSLLGNSCR